MSGRRIQIPSLLKAEFREKARAIVHKDREFRKWGSPVNTAGEIAQALEQAYRAGHQAALQPSPAQDDAEKRSLAWIEIPPRPRSAFQLLCVRSWDQPRSLTTYVAPKSGYLWNAPMGKWVWADRDLYPHEKGISDQSVQVLVRLELLMEIEAQGHTYAVVTPQGWACWQRYLQDHPRE